LEKPSLLHLHAFNLSGEEQGQYYHRVLNPTQRLNQTDDFNCFESNWFAQGALDAALAADLLVVHGYYGMEVTAVMKLRRAAGKVTLIEMGDEPFTARTWLSTPFKPSHAFTAGYMSAATLADGMQFSSQGLAQTYGSWRPAFAVLPNIVDAHDDMPFKDNGFRIGWAGTRSHLGDLQRLVPMLCDFCAAHPDVTFALMADQAIGDLFTALDPRQFEHTGFGSYDAYRNFLRSLHVGIAPLAPGRFNAGRSDVKPIEIAFSGAAVIVEDAPAFSGLSGLFPTFTDPQELYHLLQQMKADRAFLQHSARRGYILAKRRRGQRPVLARHLAWYRGWKVPASGHTLEFTRDSRQEMAFIGVFYDKTSSQQARLAKALDLQNRWPDHLPARWLAGRLLQDAGRDAEAQAAFAPMQGHHLYAPLIAKLNKAEGTV
jgi:hypothetical protein